MLDALKRQEPKHVAAANDEHERPPRRTAFRHPHGDTDLAFASDDAIADGRDRREVSALRELLGRNRAVALWPSAGASATLERRTTKEAKVHGTLICAVTDGAENDDAVARGVAISERLGLRLVLTHVVDGIALGNGDGEESVTMKADRAAAERRLEELARNHDLEERAERRVAVGEPARLLGQIASEEAADVIVVGARTRGWGRRGLESRLAQELETETPVPVLIALPRTRRPRMRQAASGARRR
jgi:nucleotide-binding universal stress UspA family protein